MCFLATAPHLNSARAGELSEPELERNSTLIALSSLNTVHLSWKLTKIKQREYGEEGLPAHIECWLLKVGFDPIQFALVSAEFDPSSPLSCMLTTFLKI